MGKSFNTGLLTNGIAQDSSNNIGIGGAANASYKLAVTGNTLGTGTAFDFFTSSGIGSSGVTGLLRVVTAGTSSAIAVGQANSSRYTSILANEHIIYNDDFFMRTNGAFPLSLGTNNTIRLSILSSGALVTYGSSMNIRGTASYLWFTESGVADKYLIGSQAGSSDLVFRSNSYDFSTGTERMRITSGGLVAIGGSNATFIDYSANVARFYGGSATNTFGLGAGSAIYYQGDNSQFYPTADNARSIGLGSLRYTAIWAVNGTIQTSDEREKTDIIDSDLGLDFVTKLRPVSFKWKVGQNTETTETITDEEGNEKIQSVITPRAGIRTHYGLIAQEVEQLLNGKDFGGFIHDKDSDVKGLRYDQFVPLLIKAIQEQQEIINNLSAKVTALENK